MKKLTKISVFYKNDIAGGYGVTFSRIKTPNSNHLSKKEFRVVKQTIDQLVDGGTKLLKNKGWTTNDILAQLESFIVTPNRSLQDDLIIVSNIILLTTAGVIPQDEFNGTQYMYTN